MVSDLEPWRNANVGLASRRYADDHPDALMKATTLALIATAGSTFGLTHTPVLPARPLLAVSRPRAAAPLAVAIDDGARAFSRGARSARRAAGRAADALCAPRHRIQS
jgi:hypothetical protein